MLRVLTAVDVYQAMSVTGEVIAMVSFKTQEILVFLAYSVRIQNLMVRGEGEGWGMEGFFFPSLYDFFLTQNKKRSVSCSALV